MKSIFEYYDYRQYLRDFYEEKKKSESGFSYRSFSEKAGINAAASLFYVIESKRNLSRKSVEQYIQALELGKREAEYFRNLVFYNQAKKSGAKAQFLEKLMLRRRTENIFTVEKEKYEFYAEWYHSVIRELVNVFPVKDDFKALGRMVNPPISASRAQKSIELLEKLGYIQKDENGAYRQTYSLIQTGPVQEYAILQFQSDMLKRGLESFEKTVSADKMSSSTTFSISKATFEIFKQKSREFRKELLEIAAKDQNPQRVYQMAITLFPVSRTKKEKMENKE